MRVFGFVNALQSAPNDFDAITVVDAAAVGAVLAVEWAKGQEPQVVLDDTEITLNLADSPLVHRVDRTGVAVDLTSFPGVSEETTAKGGGLF